MPADPPRRKEVLMNAHFGVRNQILHLGLAGALLLMAGSAFAQSITGTIVGTLRDSSGGAIVGAALTVTNRDTGISVSQKSDDQGNYVVTNLPPGIYHIRVEYAGFRTSTAADNVVQVQQTTRVDMELMPGAVTEVLDVVAAAPLVRSTTSEIGHVIESGQIQVLPLNGRLFQQLITLTPGAIQRGFADFGENPAAAGARSAIHASVNGLPWSGNNFLLDGVANNEPLNAFINVTPPLEAIEQFKVQTNNPTAEFGVFGGAVVNLTMRSGTNALHGSLFEYLRNEKLNYKIREAQLMKVPYMLIVGEREKEEGTITVRKRNGENLPAMTPQDFAERVRGECDEVMSGKR